MNSRSKQSQPAESLAPSAVETERLILGCLVLGNRALLSDAQSVIRSPEFFYDPRNRTIWEVLCESTNTKAGKLIATLESLNLLTDAGGADYVTSLSNDVASPDLLSGYLTVCRDKYRRRLIIQAAQRTIQQAEGTGEVDEIIEQTEKEFVKISREGKSNDARPIGDSVDAAVKTIDDNWKSEGKSRGMETGFQKLDFYTGGLHNGHLVIVAARPSVGKSTFAMNIASNAAIALKMPVGVFSLEMKALALTLRMIAAESAVEWQSITEEFLWKKHQSEIIYASKTIRNAPIFIDDTRGLSILQLCARARRMYLKHNIKLLIVDYLQLLHSTKKRGDANKTQEIADITCGLMDLAGELNIPIIALSQLNRDSEKENRKPKLSDLRDGGSIEQDAHLVLLLHEVIKKQKEGEEPPDENVADVRVIIGKQREGKRNKEVPLIFYKNITRFETPKTVIEQEDMPI